MTLTYRQTIAWAWRCAAGQRGRIVAACLLGALRVTLGLTFVWVSKSLVDTATLGPGNTSTLLRLSILLALLMLTEMGITQIVNYLSNQTEARMKNALVERLYSHLIDVKWAHLGSVHTGDLLNRLIEDTRVLADTVCKSVPQALIMVIQFVAAFGLLYYMSWRLALCVVAIMPFFVLLSKVYVTGTRKITAQVRKCDSAIQTNLQEGLQHHIIVQTLECEPQMKQQLGSLLSNLYGHTMRRTRFGIFSHSMVRLGFIGCFLTAFLWSIWHLQSGAITYGTMTAFLQLVGRIQHPMAGLSQIIPSLVHSISAIDRLADVESMPTETKGNQHRVAKPAGVRLEHVTFSYGQGEREIFSDFCYDFTPGSRTVIMGATGIGKSTLVRLLLNLLQPQSGHIQVYDQRESVEVSPATRCNMTYVPQGNSLLDGTIRDNLLLGNPSATNEQMRQALDVAAANFVYDLPLGLDTRCGELGTSLSEGQAQRIAIARALLRGASIMLFDEFNSSLDQATAETLLKRLLKSYPMSTMIFISHRPEICDHVTQVLRLG